MNLLRNSSAKPPLDRRAGSDRAGGLRTIPEDSSSIWVIAGVNGAGKSSIAGATIREAGGLYYNPDEAARRFMAAQPGATQSEANSIAWNEGVRLLKKAIDERLDFAFESTLGGNTIPRLLREAATRGIEIHVWYAGLSSPELHIARVRHRVSRGATIFLKKIFDAATNSVVSTSSTCCRY